MNYNISSYASHIKDKVRTQAYISALQQYITPEAVVLDLGAGTGFFSLLACQLGAKHVYAIERNPVIHLLHKQAKANAWSERITILQGLSTNLDLPERVDLIISDLRGGMLPLYQSHIQSLHDAYTRFLKPDGILMPSNDTIFLAAACDVDFYEKRVCKPWCDANYAFDMSPVFDKQIHTPFRHVPAVDQIVLPPQLWASIDYGQQDDPQIRNTLVWQVEAPTTIHFLCAWFESTLVDGVTYSTSPFVEKDQRPVSYSGLYLPLQKPIMLQADEQLEVDLMATYIRVRDNYTYTWRTRVLDARQNVRLAYQQSTFYVDSYQLPDLKTVRSKPNHEPTALSKSLEYKV